MSDAAASRNITPPPSLVSGGFEENYEQEEGVELEEIPESEYRKIFINHINSYHGKFLVTEIQNMKSQPMRNRDDDEEENENEEDSVEAIEPMYFRIYGTWKQFEEEDVQAWNCKDICNISADSYDQILQCEYIIYDINSADSTQVVEAYSALKQLEACCENRSEISQEEPHITYFILISTIMTWGETKTDFDNDTYYTEKDYRKRRPHVCYMQHMNLEKEVINAQKRHPNYLRTLVICPGVTYGGKEDLLHYIFKMAFYNKDDIEIFRPGNNIIPMIYVHDLMKMITSILRRFPDPKIRYILAIQRESVDVATFARAIASIIGSDDARIKIVDKAEIFMVDARIMTQRVFNHCTLNLNLRPRYFENFKFEMSGEEFHSNTPKICEEYYESRGLAPIKILIHGPPFSGKTTLARSLAKHYNLPIIQRSNLFETSVNRLKHKIYKAEQYLRHFERSPEVTRVIPFEFIEEVTMNISDWRSKIDYIVANRNRKDNFPVIKMCLQDRLGSSLCSKNQGYIMEGFEITRAQAEEIFMLDEGEEGAVEEIEEGGTGPAMLNPAIKPHFVIILNAADQLLYERGKATMDLVEEEEDYMDDSYDEDSREVEFSSPRPRGLVRQLSTILENVTDEENEDYLIRTPAERDPDCDRFDIRDVIGMRILAYRANDYEDLSLLNFFLDMDIIPTEINQCLETCAEEIFCRIKMIIGAPRKYPLTGRELKELEEMEMMAMRKLECEQQRLHLAHLEQEKMEHELRMKEYAEALLKAKNEELQIIEQRSLPLRHYLMQTIIPRLTKGLLEVAKVRPNDPIEYLADYLFRHNIDGGEVSESMSFISDTINEDEIASKNSSLNFCEDLPNQE